MDSVEGKRTFRTLDGLRGIAALIILLFHLSPAWPDLPFWPSAYLSVDLFFMLSGFVIGHAYHDRLSGGLSFRRFLRGRLTRVYPIYLLSCMLGLAVPVIIAVATWQAWIARPALAAVPWALLMLPAPRADPAHWFILNPPAWSLVFEMVVYIGYALLFPWLRMRMLLGIAIASAALMIVASDETGSINVAPTTWWGLLGLYRPVFSFSVGLILHRLHRAGTLPTPVVRIRTIVLLFLCLLLVPATGESSPWMSAMVVIVGFPAVVTLAIANEPVGRVAGAMTFGATISYALYAIHWPVMVAVGRLADVAGIDTAFANLAVIPIAIGTAWLTHRWYDTPARQWINRWFFARSRQQPLTFAVEADTQVVAQQG